MAERVFSMQPAKRERVPLWVGLSGASGCGKTVSALRLATGIQRVAGGEIAYIDTEARRALHYADKFRFQHVPFEAPFGSLDYLTAVQQVAKAGARVIVVDSMSHEHEGVGGMLDFQERELERMAGSDWQKRERVKMAAWIAPKAARRKLINGLLQINANFVFCFRAKNTVKPVKVNGKTEIVSQGFIPISGDEFIYEMTMHCMLPPASGGVPQWSSEYGGERQMMKLPMQFRELMSEQKPLDEQLGEALATWAAGGAAPDAPARASTGEPPKESEPPGSKAPRDDTSAEPCWEPIGGGKCKRERGHSGPHIRG